MAVKLIVVCYIIFKKTFGMEFDFEGSSENSTMNYKTTLSDTEPDFSTFTLYKIGRYCSHNVFNQILQTFTCYFYWKNL